VCLFTIKEIVGSNYKAPNNNRTRISRLNIGITKNEVTSEFVVSKTSYLVYIKQVKKYEKESNSVFIMCCKHSSICTNRIKT
jgi:hypothetical protein